MDKTITKQIYLLIFIMSVYTLWYLANKDMKAKKESIQENYTLTVGKVVDFKDNRSFDHYYYEFYHNGNIIRNYSNIYGFKGEKCIGRYYKVEFSSKEPKFSNIFLDKETFNSIEIEKAGFKNKK